LRLARVFAGPVRAQSQDRFRVALLIFGAALQMLLKLLLRIEFGSADSAFIGLLCLMFFCHWFISFFGLFVGTLADRHIPAKCETSS
jgi:hypothetical protein